MREMRRADRAVTGPEEIRAIAAECRVCRLGLSDEDGVYIVPMNFGCRWEGEKLILYFHCAKEGRKLDLIRRNPAVGVEMDCRRELIEAEEACGYGCRYASLIGTGTARTVNDPEEKREGLRALMRQQTGREFSFTEAQTAKVEVIRVDVEDYSCKEHR